MAKLTVCTTVKNVETEWLQNHKKGKGYKTRKGKQGFNVMLELKRISE